MVTRQPRRHAYIAGLPAAILSALAAVEGIRLYTSHNAVHCGGGLGWIGAALTVYATLALALLATLVALVFALVVAIMGHHWAWIAVLAAATALGMLIFAGAGSPLSHTLVGSALGFGCSWFYPEAAQSLAPVIVAAPALAFLLTGLRRQ